MYSEIQYKIKKVILETSQPDDFFTTVTSSGEAGCNLLPFEG